MLNRSFSCLSDANTQSGSEPTLTSRTKAVFLHLLSCLLVLKSLYQGSSERPSPDILFCWPDGITVLFRLRLRSLACWRFLGTCPTPEHISSPFKLLLTTWRTEAHGNFSLETFSNETLVLSHVLTYILPEVFAFPWAECSTGCSFPPLNQYCTKQYRWSWLSGTKHSEVKGFPSQNCFNLNFSFYIESSFEQGWKIFV